MITVARETGVAPGTVTVMLPYGAGTTQMSGVDPTRWWPLYRDDGRDHPPVGPVPTIPGFAGAHGFGGEMEDLRSKARWAWATGGLTVIASSAGIAALVAKRGARQRAALGGALGGLIGYGLATVITSAMFP